MLETSAEVLICFIRAFDHYERTNRSCLAPHSPSQLAPNRAILARRPSRPLRFSPTLVLTAPSRGVSATERHRSLAWPPGAAKASSRCRSSRDPTSADRRRSRSISGLNAALSLKRSMAADTAPTSVASISTNQSPAPGLGAEGSSVIGFDSAGSLSIRCMEMMPSSSAGSSCSRSAARSLSSPPAGAQPDNAERCAAADAAADRDARDRADHVLEAGDIGLRPCGLVRQRGAIGRAVQHLEGLGGVEAEIFRVAVMGDIAAGFEEAVDCDALFEMFAVVPAIELGFVRGVDVHRRQQHAFSGHRHFLDSYLLVLEAMSAIAFITASRTPGSYSVWPAPSTKRISASRHTRGKRMRGRGRAQQIVAALHDDAGDACRACPRRAATGSAA